MEKYSVVISPPDTVISRVRQMKRSLESAIGNYASVHSWAHITISVFNTDEQLLPNWENRIAAFAALQVPVFLYFNSTGSFTNGAFYLAPDTNSHLILARMIKDFRKGLPTLSRPTGGVVPHMTIGRQLNAAQLSNAITLIQAPDIRFHCDDITLRRFNPGRMQYDIYKRFPFKADGHLLFPEQ